MSISSVSADIDNMPSSGAALTDSPIQQTNSDGRIADDDNNPGNACRDHAAVFDVDQQREAHEKDDEMLVSFVSSTGASAEMSSDVGSTTATAANPGPHDAARGSSSSAAVVVVADKIATPQQVPNAAVSARGVEPPTPSVPTTLRNKSILCAHYIRSLPPSVLDRDGPEACGRHGRCLYKSDDCPYLHADPRLWRPLPSSVCKFYNASSGSGTPLHCLKGDCPFFHGSESLRLQLQQQQQQQRGDGCGGGKPLYTLAQCGLRIDSPPPPPPLPPLRQGAHHRQPQAPLSRSLTQMAPVSSAPLQSQQGHRSSLQVMVEPAATQRHHQYGGAGQTAMLMHPAHLAQTTLQPATFLASVPIPMQHGGGNSGMPPPVALVVYPFAQQQQPLHQQQQLPVMVSVPHGQLLTHGAMPPPPHLQPLQYVVPSGHGYIQYHHDGSNTAAHDATMMRWPTPFAFNVAPQNPSSF